MLLASYPTGAFDGDGGARYDALGVLAVENGKFVPNANLRSVSTSSAGLRGPSRPSRSGGHIHHRWVPRDGLCSGMLKLLVAEVMVRAAISGWSDASGNPRKSSSQVTPRWREMDSNL